METKNYIGTSRPCGEYDKVTLKIIESNLNYFNANKRKGILSIEHYIDCGDQWKILKDDGVLLYDMTLDQVHYAIAGIINYTRERS